MSGVEDRLGKVEASLGTLTGNVSTMCAARKSDKESARKEAKERHAELKALIGDNHAELRQITGSMNEHETRISNIEVVDEERKRVAGAGTLGLVTPLRVAQGVGVTGVGGGIVWLLVKLTELQDVLAQLANSP